MRRLVIALALVLAACGGDDDDDGTTTTTSTTASTTTTATSTTTTSTTAFEGATTPTSVAAEGLTSVPLLTAVRVGDDRVVFELEGDAAPGVDAGYVEEAIADGSGEPVEVAGEALLQVRMEPASGVDLSGDEARETYTGPTEIAGTGVVVEAERTGDFEANLTWVIGLDRERPYRVLRLADPARVTVLFDPS